MDMKGATAPRAPAVPARGATIVERQHGNAGLVGAVIEILDEDPSATFMHERKRIGIEPKSGIGNHIPCGTGDRLAC